MQSSWTKRAVDVDSPQPVSTWDQFADPHDSTCAQVNHPRQEAFGNNWVPENATRSPVAQDDELGGHLLLICTYTGSLFPFLAKLMHLNFSDRKNMGKDLKIGVSSIPNLQLEDRCEKGLTNMECTNKDKSSEMNSKKDDEEQDKKELDLNSEEPNAEKAQAVDLMGVSTNSIDTQIESAVLDIPNGLSKVACMKDKAIQENKEIPFFELILKRSRDVQDTEPSAHDRNVLRHSDISAFSRYRNAHNLIFIRTEPQLTPRIKLILSTMQV